MAHTTHARPNTPADMNADHVIVGRVKGSWGLRGDLKIELLSDNPARFSPGSTLYLDNKPVHIEQARTDPKGRLLVKLDIAHDRTAADRLVGQVVTIPREETVPLPVGSYYHYQIVDMDVWSEVGVYLGQVKEILDTPGNDVYVLGREDEKDLLIPVLANVVLDVDLDQNRMTVQLPPGLQP